MRRKKIGVVDFHGSVDITDPCYDKDVWCRMNDVKISDGEYTCNVWHHTDKGTYKDGTPYSYILVGAIGIYRNGDIPRQKDMEKIGSMVDAEMQKLMDSAHMSRDAAAVLAAALIVWKLTVGRRRYRYGRSVPRRRGGGYRGRRRH